jgi:hypothetical protein
VRSLSTDDLLVTSQSGASRPMLGAGTNAGDDVHLVRHRVEDIAGDERPRRGLVVAVAAPHSPARRDPSLDQDREIAARANEGAVGDLLDPIARNLPLLADVRGAHLAGLAHRLVA